MWGFLSAIFNKIASVAVTVLVAVGLVSAPLPPVSKAPVTATSTQEMVQEIALSQPEKEDKPAVPVVAHLASSGQAKTEKAEIEEKLAQTAQLLEVLKKASPPPPVPTPVPPPSSSASSLPSGTFRLPNGTLVDVNGNVIQPAPQSSVQTSTPTEIDYSQYANPPTGTTLQILRSVAVSMEFNPNLSCEDLGFSHKQRNGYLCKFYKTQKSSYSWEIVENYTQDLSQYKQSSGVSSGTAAGSSRPPTGSTVQIPRSVITAIGLNDNLSCESLGLAGDNLNLCKLYKDYKNDYLWNIAD